MTTTQELIAQLREGWLHGDSANSLKAADALEALQAENARLWEDREESHQTAGSLMSECSRLEREREAELARFRMTVRDLNALQEQQAGELDAALARLAELEKQEPVAEVDYNGRGNIKWRFGPQILTGTPLYTAAGASPVEPSRDHVARDLAIAHVQNSEAVGNWRKQPSQARELSDEEIHHIAAESQEGISPHDDTLRFARAIIAAIKAKGEAS